MSVKKVTVLILSLVMLLFSACGNPEAVSSITQSGNSLSGQAGALKTLQLLYCENDTMNPYKTVSKVNGEIGLLIFDSLVKVDNNFKAVPSLAESIEIKENICTVSLKNAKFSDSSEVTSKDVLFSYELALESERYSYLFYNVKGLEIKDDSTLIFTLKRHDPYFDSLLTFPILKEGSDELKNEDNVEISPIGSGKFVQAKDNSALLVPNKYYHGEETKISSITLINAPDLESMEHYVKIGATDFYYTNLSDDSVIRMSGHKSSVNLNNLVYIGINNNYAPLKNDTMRFALSAAIDRNELVRLAYYGEAKAANGFFHPDWEKTAGYQSISDDSNPKIVIENLEEIGYNKLDKDGFRITKSGSKLSFNLLVNKDSASKLALANEIASQLLEYGIRINIQAVSYENYLTYLKEGNFQLYIGEVKVLPNMDISSLVFPGGSVAYGIPEKASVPDDSVADDSTVIDSTDYRVIFEGYFEGKNTIADVSISLLSSMPLIPIAYRNGLIFSSDKLENPDALFQ